MNIDFLNQEAIKLDILKQADDVTLRLEIAKKKLEQAKLNLDQSKSMYEEVFSRCDQAGISKAKLKKLTEERVLALFESGVIVLENNDMLVSSNANTIANLKTDKNAKKAKKKEVPAEEVNTESSELNNPGSDYCMVDTAEIQELELT